MRYLCERCGCELPSVTNKDGNKTTTAKFFYDKMSIEPTFALCSICEEEFKDWLGVRISTMKPKE